MKRLLGTSKNHSFQQKNAPKVSYLKKGSKNGK